MKNIILGLTTLLLAACVTTALPPKKNEPIQVPAHCNIAISDQELITKQIDGIEWEGEPPVFTLVYHFLQNKADKAKWEQLAIENTEILNDEMSGYMSFDIDTLMYWYDYDIPIDDFSNKDFRTLLESIEEDEVINIFVTSTNTSLRGFTTVFNTWFEGYEIKAPKYDNIFLSWISVEEKNALVHEVGHFFGLNHVWTYAPSELDNLGITTDRDSCLNVMNYGCCPEGLTETQKWRMLMYGALHRNYLIGYE